MNPKSNFNQGFTLIEIIIVIIIVGVLAGLALPRFFSTVEFSKSTEALNAMTFIRGAMERCYFREGTFANCTIGDLDISNPSDAVGAHFKSYDISLQTVDSYVITATRGTINGGDDTSTIQIVQDANGVTRSGRAFFKALNN
jgi:prepilin-type N-terminal cleavage/methylation domain-containing protein